MTMKKQQTGFTLIELVVVIVILGILAVTAAPRFLNLSKDARIASLQGLEGALKSANSLVYSQAAINGVEQNVSDSISVYGQDVAIRLGYTEATFADLNAVLDAELTEITNPTLPAEQGFGVYEAPAASAGVTFSPAGIPTFNNCSLRYNFDGDNLPVYSLTTTGC